MSFNDALSSHDPLGFFVETSKEKKARKRSEVKKRKPRQLTSGDSLLTGSQTATSGTLLG